MDGRDLHSTAPYMLSLAFTTNGACHLWTAFPLMDGRKLHAQIGLLYMLLTILGDHDPFIAAYYVVDRDAASSHLWYFIVNRPSQMKLGPNEGGVTMGAGW